VIEADFTGGKEVYDHIEKELAGIDVAVLVNNVGMSYDHPEYFLSVKNNKQVRQSFSVVPLPFQIVTYSNFMFGLWFQLWIIDPR